MTWRFGNAAFAPIACAIALAIDPWLNEPVSRRCFVILRKRAAPDGWLAHVAGEDCVIIGEVAHDPGHVLRMHRWSTGGTCRQLVERVAIVGVMLARALEERPIGLVFQQRKQRVDRRGDIADEPEVDPRFAAQVFGPDVDLAANAPTSSWRT